jgi:hypothetical protein
MCSWTLSSRPAPQSPRPRKGFAAPAGDAARENPFVAARLEWRMRLVIFVLVGAALGFAWHRFVGCRTGTCPITANRYTSMLYGAAMGFLLGKG